MTLRNSKARSKFKRYASYLLMAAALFSLLAAALLPTVGLNYFLKNRLPELWGGEISYEQARGGFLFRSVTVTGLKIKRPNDESYFCEEMSLDGINPLNWLALARNSYVESNRPLSLAGAISLKGVVIEGPPDLQVMAAELEMRRPALVPNQLRAGTGGFQLLYEMFDLRKLSLHSSAASLTLSRLEGRDQGPGSLSLLKLNGLEGAFQNETLSVGAVTVGGLKNEVMNAAISGQDPAGALVWLLASCDTLDLARASWHVNSEQVASIGNAVFDYRQLDKSGTVTYTRRLDCAIDLAALEREIPASLWKDFREIAGNVVNFSFSLEADFNIEAGWADLKKAALSSRELGELELKGRLTSLNRLKPGLDPSQILFSASNSSLEHFALGFADQGLMAGLYRYHAKNIFQYASSKNVAENLMIYYVMPWAAGIEREHGLDNLPSVVSEIEHFLTKPESFRISAAPARPLPLISLANPDKYDIIERLNLVLEVNRRAPVTVTVSSGIFQERLPSSPKAMENLFLEQNID